MIPVFMRCCKCKKYEEAGTEGGSEIRTTTSQGKIEYRKLPTSWNVITAQTGSTTREAVICGDCLPNVLKEVFG